MAIRISLLTEPARASSYMKGRLSLQSVISPYDVLGFKNEDVYRASNLLHSLLKPHRINCLRIVIADLRFNPIFVGGIFGRKRNG